MFECEDRELTPREHMLLKKLEREYTPEIAETVLKPLLTQTSPVSLRALDWAVVNWSKQHNVVCSSSIPGQMTNVHHSYRRTLAFWKRKLFDPFRRRHRIKVVIGNTVYETTLGQANFALFAYKSGVYAYVLCNIDAIEADMNKVSKRQKKERAARKAGHKRTKRRELTPSTGAICVAYQSPVTVTFE